MQGQTKTSVDKLLYILFSILMENNIFNSFFSPTFLLKTLEIILETKILVKKRLHILFSVLMENIVLLVYIYLIFCLGIFQRVPPYVEIYI